MSENGQVPAVSKFSLQKKRISLLNCPGLIGPDSRPFNCLNKTLSPAEPDWFQKYYLKFGKGTKVYELNKKIRAVIKK